MFPAVLLSVSCSSYCSCGGGVIRLHLGHLSCPGVRIRLLVPLPKGKLHYEYMVLCCAESVCWCCLSRIGVSVMPCIRPCDLRRAIALARHRAPYFLGRCTFCRAPETIFGCMYAFRSAAQLLLYYD